MTTEELRSRYEAAKALACPDGCGKNIPMCYEPHPHFFVDFHRDPSWANPETWRPHMRCAAPSLDKFAADEITRLEGVWRCFHCGFETNNPVEAEAHFGERDDAAEFTPTCTWWAKLSASERAQEFQDLRQQLNEERDESGRLNIANEGLQYRVDGQLSEIHSFAPFRECRSIHDIFHLYDSMEGRALLAEEQNAAQAKRSACAEAERDAAIERSRAWNARAIFAERSLSDAHDQFIRHTKAVEGYLSELYAIMVDPLADGVIPVQKVMDALKAAALRDREDCNKLADALSREKALAEALEKAPCTCTASGVWCKRCSTLAAAALQAHKDAVQGTE